MWRFGTTILENEIVSQLESSRMIALLQQEPAEIREHQFVIEPMNTVS